MPFFDRNIGRGERGFRLAVGVAIVGAAYVLLASPASHLVALIGVAGVVTGLAGFCPACAIAGRKSPS